MRKFLIVILAGVLLGSCGRSTFRRFSGGVWNTTFNVTYKSDRELDDSVMMVFNRVDLSLSVFNPSSLVSALNRAAESSPADSLLSEVFRVSQRVNRLSGGMFDPTVGPLVELWGFGRAGGDVIMPTDGQVVELWRTVGIGRCRLGNDGQISKPFPSTEFNFSAIAKGYACDLVADMLRRNGVEDYMVEIGGEIALGGFSPRGTAWRVMVEAPVDSASEARGGEGGLRVLELGPEPRGVATSGNYRNYRVDSLGRRIGHTISPVTGYPIATTITSATIVAPRCILADALATAVMAMEPDSAMAMLKKLAIEGIEGYILEGNMLKTVSR